jgi:hypothetical protein
MKIGNRLTSVVALVLVAALIIPSPYSISPLFLQSDASQSSEKLSLQSTLLQTHEFFSAIQTAPLVSSVPNAYAVTPTVLDSSLCGTIGGSWSSGSCTLASPYTIASGDTLEIPFGATLVLHTPGTSGWTLTNSGTLINYGIIDSKNDGKGLSNGGLKNIHGTISNYGTIIAESTNHAVSLFNQIGTISNHGIINDVSPAGFESIINAATLTNYGLIIVANSGSLFSTPITDMYCGAVTGAVTGITITTSTGFSLAPGVPCTNPLTGDFLIKQDSTLEIQSGVTLVVSSRLATDTRSTLKIDGGGMLIITSPGQFANSGAVSNSGLIYIDNSQPNDVGINNGGTTLTNIGTINIGNTGSSSEGIVNFQKLENFGAINVDNSGSFTTGLDNVFGNLFNENCGSVIGTITILNAGTFTGNPAQTTSSDCNSQPPSIPEFPFSYSLVIMFVAVAGVYVAIRQGMVPYFKRF